MTTIRTVVAALDFSPASNAAVRRAARLAAEQGTALCLLHAFDASVWRDLKSDFDVQGTTGELSPELRMQQHLAEAAASLAAQTGLEVGIHFGSGPLATVLAAYVGSHAGSLVVIGSRAEPTLSGLGSTALKVVRQPACPVLIVRAADDRPYDTVLSAVDLREGSIQAASLAVALFPDAHHHLLYALDALPAVSGAVGAEPLRLLHESLYAKAEHDLQDLARQLSAGTRHPVAAVVADDVPARAILVGAANLAADCVVVGHHGQGTATDSHLGSMAQHVIYAALSDVLVGP